MSVITIPVSDLTLGDLVDLEGDQFADPKGDHPAFEFEWTEVIGIEQETKDCIAVTFEHDVVGFPVDHKVMVIRADPDEVQE